MGTPHTSSYGTRSTQSRLQESEGLRSSTRPPPAKVKPPQAVDNSCSLNPELGLPMQITLEPPSVVAYRRSLEMAARRQAMAAEVDARREDSQTSKEQAALEAERCKANEAAAWKAASEKVAQLKAEQEAAAKKIA